MLDSAIIYTLYQIKILQNSLGSIWTPGWALAEKKLTLGTYRLMGSCDINHLKELTLQSSPETIWHIIVEKITNIHLYKKKFTS